MDVGILWQSPEDQKILSDRLEKSIQAYKGSGPSSEHGENCKPKVGVPGNLLWDNKRSFRRAQQETERHSFKSLAEKFELHPQR